MSIRMLASSQLRLLYFHYKYFAARTTLEDYGYHFHKGKIRFNFKCVFFSMCTILSIVLIFLCDEGLRLYFLGKLRQIGDDSAGFVFVDQEQYEAIGEVSIPADS